MIKFKFVFVLSFFFCSYLYAQDTIYLKDGDQLIVKVIDIETYRINYKKLSNLEGPKYVLNNSDIQKIHLFGGEILVNKNNQLVDPAVEVKEVVTENPAESAISPFDDDHKKKLRVQKSIKYNKRKNLFGYNYASLIILNLEFDYERIIDKVGYFGLKIPIMFNMGIQANYLDKRNLFTTGIHANIYPLGQGKITYFTGPVIRYSLMEDNDQINTNNILNIQIEPTKSNYLGFYMNNGVLFRASPFLSFGISMGFGVRKDLNRSNENSEFDMIGEGSISFRF